MENIDKVDNLTTAGGGSMNALRHIYGMEIIDNL
jgi:hypothetical protein